MIFLAAAILTLMLVMYGLLFLGLLKMMFRKYPENVAYIIAMSLIIGLLVQQLARGSSEGFFSGNGLIIILICAFIIDLVKSQPKQKKLQRK